MTEINNNNSNVSEYGEYVASTVSTTTTKKKTNGINGNTVEAYTPTKERDELLKKYGDTSKAIRALDKEGLSNGAIAKLLNVRPQHVSNVRRQKYNGGK